MKYSYFYSVIEHIILVSGICTKTIASADRNYYDPFCDYTHWSDAFSNLCSMGFDYYCI